MDFLSAAFSSILSIIAFCLFVAGVLKLFQIANTLGEIKDALHQFRRGSDFMGTPQAEVAANPASGASGEEMLRALDAQMHIEEALKQPEEQALNPEIVNPR